MPLQHSIFVANTTISTLASQYHLTQVAGMAGVEVTVGEMAAPVAPPAEEQPQPPPLAAVLEEPQQPQQQPPPLAPMPEVTMTLESTELPQAQPPLPEEPQDAAQLPPLEVKVVVDSAAGAAGVVQTKGPGTPTGAKRSREGGEEKDGEKKWSGWPGDNVFRMVVPVQKVGGIIGRKGEFVKKMCEETRSRIKILEGVPGTPERIVSSFTFTCSCKFFM